MWAGLEVVLWDSSSLRCQDSSNLGHMSQQQELSPLANTSHKSAVAFQSRRNSRALPIGLSLCRRNCQITTRNSLLCFLSTKSQHTMIRKEGKVNQCHRVTSEDQRQQSPVRTAKSGEASQCKAPSTVCWVILIPFPNTTCALKCLLQQNIPPCVCFSRNNLS